VKLSEWPDGPSIGSSPVEGKTAIGGK